MSGTATGGAGEGAEGAEEVEWQLTDYRAAELVGKMEAPGVRAETKRVSTAGCRKTEVDRDPSPSTLQASANASASC